LLFCFCEDLITLKMITKLSEKILLHY
jgi:hypothetical protein